MSPTARTLKWARDNKLNAAVVERFYGGTRHDAYGFGDILIHGPYPESTRLIQVTTASNMSARLKKIVTIPEAFTWLQAGNGITVHGWAKRGPRGKRKTWQLFTHNVTPSDFEANAKR